MVEAFAFPVFLSERGTAEPGGGFARIFWGQHEQLAKRAILPPIELEHIGRTASPDNWRKTQRADHGCLVARDR